jgi:hypothetical protein
MIINFLEKLQNPQIRHERLFEVMRDFRKGGLNPSNYDEFMSTVKSLPKLVDRTYQHYNVFNKFSLTDLTEKEFNVVMNEVKRRGKEKSKFCWHPEASTATCNVDAAGKIIISAAHSIQNNGVLSKIIEDGEVMSYNLNKSEFEGKEVHKNQASIFLGFCNKHDAIFRPIENYPYTGTDEQHFLYAYRGFVVSSHKKIEVSNWINFGPQSDNDIVENRKIFDLGIINKDFSKVETEVFVLPAFYPIAVSSSFYLDYDFEGNPIKHSDDRMEDIHVTLFPEGNKTYFLLSYFKHDAHLYGKLGAQLQARNNLKSDITMLIAAHTENVFFNPKYYKVYIEQYEKFLDLIFFQTQMDYFNIDENDKMSFDFSFTPSNYLHNAYEINFFGY